MADGVTKYTAGPWTVRGRAPYPRTIVSVSTALDGTRTTRFIARIVVASPTAQDEAEANENLIAAAPELLEALQALDAAIDLDPDDGIAFRLAISDATGLKEACCKAKRAIAKAEGGHS